MAKKSEASLVCVVGMRGCGKSTLTHRLAHQNKFNRKIVFDIVKEWNGNYTYVNSAEEFRTVFKKLYMKPAYTIVVRFDFGTDPKQIVKTQTEIVNLIYRVGYESELETCVIFEEAQFYFPNSGLHPVNFHFLTTGRHAHANVIANSQRPASLSKLLISQSEEVYVGKLFESNDMGYLYECMGDLAFEARDLKKLEFIYYPVGHPENIAIIDLNST